MADLTQIQSFLTVHRVIGLVFLCIRHCVCVRYCSVVCVWSGIGRLMQPLPCSQPASIHESMLTPQNDQTHRQDDAIVSPASALLCCAAVSMWWLG